MGYMGSDFATSSNPNYNFAEEEKKRKRIQEEVWDEIFDDEDEVKEENGSEYKSTPRLRT